MITSLPSSSAVYNNKKLWFIHHWRFIFFILILLACCPSCHAQFCDSPACLNDKYNNRLDYISGRQFDTSPEEGVTVISTNNETDVFLDDGVAAPVLYNFAFMPPLGSVPSDYAISFSCDDDLVFDTSTCQVNPVVTSITGSALTAYNVSVSCDFDRFPGSTQCSLSAAGTNSNFFSTPLAVNVYGFVFYLPDENGALSASSTIVSGSERTYTLPNYDRVDEGVRQIESLAFVPGASSAAEISAVLDSATISVSSTDLVFRYDTETCSFTSGAASFQDGSLVLADNETCGMGMAVRDGDTFPTLGFQVRPYKSGNVTLDLTWGSTFGNVTLADEFKQVLKLSIIETAPPVIVSVSRSDIYRSTPCEAEFLTMNVTNVNFADARQITVVNEDSSTTIWSESSTLNYDAANDWSTVTFESAGGDGKDVPFTLNAIYINESTIDGVVLGDGVRTILENGTETTANLLLSFSTPPVLTSMTPSSVQLAGGETITLSGTFDGFRTSDFIFLGGFQLDNSQFSIISVNLITFIAPAQQTVGNQFIYDVTVRICSERSNAIPLTYISQPTVSIIAVDSIFNADTQSYTLPQGSDSTFIADVSGNSIGINYAWSIFAADGTEVPLDDSVVSDTQRFIFDPSLLTTGQSYTLNATVTNSLGLSDTQVLSFGIAGVNTEWILTNVFPVGTLYRSGTTPTLIQSTVSSSVTSDVTLVWLYGNESFIVQQGTNASTTVNTTVTGPTKLGLVFYITKSDLVVGNTPLSLTGSLNIDPSITYTSTTTIQVAASDLIAIINDGINGTLTQSVNDIALTAANSSDPDILTGEGDNTAGLAYSWDWCFKSLDPTFLTGTENCSSLLPADPTVQSFDVPSQSLLDERLDNSTGADPTLFSFGVTVTKDNRTSSAFLYFEFRTVETAERVPSLSSLDVVDRTGVKFADPQAISTTGVIVIQPVSTDSLVQWSFDMVYARQRYLFSLIGTFLTGNGFSAGRNEKTRLALGFPAGVLDPATEYFISVVASANDTSLQTSYQVSFRTAEIPQLTCLPPSVTNGIVSETELIISAELSFDIDDVAFCFFLVDETGQRVSVGKGCSSLSFASFTFQREGVYDVECLVKTLTGLVLQNQTIDANITLSYPVQDVALSQIEILSQRLVNLTETADRCEIFRDHTCISSIIFATNDLTNQVEAAVEEANNSEEAVQLQDDVKLFVQRLSALSQELASNTIFDTNQVEGSIDETFYLATISSQFIGDEATLYQTLGQVDGAINSITAEGTFIQSDAVVEKVRGIVNVTLSNAYIFGNVTTDVAVFLRSTDERQAYGDLLIRTIQYVADVRRNQEGCGFVGTESTRFPPSLVSAQTNIQRANQITVLEPCDINIIIACDQEQIVQTIGSNVQADLCEGLMGSSVSGRVDGVVSEIPSSTVKATGMVKNARIFTKDMAYVQMLGAGSIPKDCITLKFRRDTVVMKENDTVIESGILSPTSTSTGRGCTEETCFNFDFNEDNSVTFSDTDDSIIVRTDTEGLVVAGVRIAVNPTNVRGDLSGFIRVLTMVIMPIAAFALIAGIVTWFMVTRGVVTYPEVDDLGWEYVERDMFGRGSVDTNNFSPTVQSQAETPGSAFNGVANEPVERKPSSAQPTPTPTPPPPAEQ